MSLLHSLRKRKLNVFNTHPFDSSSTKHCHDSTSILGSISFYPPPPPPPPVWHGKVTLSLSVVIPKCLFRCIIFYLLNHIITMHTFLQFSTIYFWPGRLLMIFTLRLRLVVLSSLCNGWMWQWSHCIANRVSFRYCPWVFSYFFFTVFLPCW